MQSPSSIAIIGAGWSGCHTALHLSSLGHTVTLIEKGPDLFNGVSGQFGIRIHKGPHYPRSSGTRESCRRTFDRFCRMYPEVVVRVEPAVYALAERDSTGQLSKVSADVFGDVCREAGECERVDLGDEGGMFGEGSGKKSEVQVAYRLDEPCALLNPSLKKHFSERLFRAGVRVWTDTEVTNVSRFNDQYCVQTSLPNETWFDKVINATGYASALPDGLLSNLPIKANIKYQACTALTYTDTFAKPGSPPMSFIVMDGWFPCLMPCIGHRGEVGKYALTHGAYTILGSFDTPAEAGDCLSSMQPDFMSGRIRPKLESEMERFWPGFTARFEYQGWKGSVLPKMVTDTEFRSSVVFEFEGVIYIFPGKISNVVDAGDEVDTLIRGLDVVRFDGYAYAVESELSRSRREIERGPVARERNTCFLQTHRELQVVVRA